MDGFGEVEIFLRPEPDNPYDAFAIRVDGKVGGGRSCILGYMPKKKAFALHKRESEGRRYLALLTDVDVDNLKQHPITFSLDVYVEK